MNKDKPNKPVERIRLDCTRQINLTLTPEMDERLRAYAQESGIPKLRIIRKAVDAWLDAHED